MADETDRRGSHWGITINNYTAEDELLLQQQPRWLRMVKGQKEVGSNGTPHIQAYANTQQIRMSALKKWLPRAHFVCCMSKEHADNMEEYVNKTETAVEGSQFCYDYRSQTANGSLTMAQVMMRMADNRWTDEEMEYRRGKQNAMIKDAMLENKVIKAKTQKEFLEEEFWDIVQSLLLEDENLVALLTQPQYLRAWINTRKVWVMKWELDRQTKLTVASASPALP